MPESTGIRPSVSWLGCAPVARRRVALGTFDGVHLGHRAVIAGSDTVVTFSPHPRAVVGEAPALLQDLEGKIDLLGRLGVAEVVLIPFDRALAAMSPADFIDEVLVGTLGATRVAVGANFTFGHRGAGHASDLIADRRFETRVEPLLESGGAVISSSRIRGLIEAGEVDEAAALLGRRFSCRCQVEPTPEGSTGNLELPRGMARPGAGTYSATLQVGEREPQAALVEIAPNGDQVMSPERGVGGGSAVIALHGRVAPSPSVECLFAGAASPDNPILK